MDAILKVTNKYSTKSIFVKQLIDDGFLTAEIDRNFIYISPKKTHKYYLNGLNIELTHKCNLNCVHCYGSFGQNVDHSFINYNWFKANITNFNYLNVKTISLTGGESTLNPDLIEIVKLILYNGFNLCLFTNGMNYNCIYKILECTKEYKYIIKVSLDWFEKTHNFIRGNEAAFTNSVKVIELISQYKNIDLIVSTVIVKDNEREILEFDNWFKNTFPNVKHIHDFIFPSRENKIHCFDTSNFNDLYLRFLDLFVNNGNPRKLRCTGGISQCTIMPNCYIKICNSADNKIFWFEHNVFDKGLVYAWENPGKNILRFRREKTHTTKDCKLCKNMHKCKLTDCRVISYNYHKELYRSNPITCFTVEKSIHG